MSRTDGRQTDGGTAAVPLLDGRLMAAVIQEVKDGTRVPGYLLGVGVDPKTIKGEKYNYLTGIQYLTPADGSGVANLCPFASPGCAAVCLNTAGHGDPRMGSTTQTARLTRTAFWQFQRSAYWRQLIKEIDALIRKARRLGAVPVIRLNGTSDIVWERTPVVIDGVTIAPNIFALYEGIQFYDYTKWPFAKRAALPSNYHLTFSRSENNHAEALNNLSNGRNVAAVFDTKKDAPLPSTWNGHTVIDADLSDLRFLDPADGVICGLRAKGYGKKDDSGFVITVDDIDDIMTDDDDFACRDTGCPSAHCPECGACDYDIANADLNDGPCDIILCYANQAPLYIGPGTNCFQGGAYLCDSVENCPGHE